MQPVDDGIGMALEDGTGVGEAQHPPGLDEQRRPHLTLQGHEVARDLGLTDHPEIGHLRDRCPVGDLLEPAQHLSIHDS